MKKIVTLFFAVGSLIFLNSCDKVSVDFPEFDSPDFVATFDIPSSDTIAIDTTIISTEIVNIDSIIKANTSDKLGAENVKKMTLKTCSIVVVGGDIDNNFANFETSSASFSSDANSTVFDIFNNLAHDNSEDYDWDVANNINVSDNLSSYVKTSGKTTFNYSFRGVMRKGTTKPLQIIMTCKFKIKASS